MTISKEAASSLAVRYQAWHEYRSMDARAPGRDEGLVSWGGLLLESLKETGITDLSSPESIRVIVLAAKRRIKDREAE